MQSRLTLISAGVLTATLIGGVAQAETPPTAQAVMEHYSDLGETIYGDAASGAEALGKAVGDLTFHPSATTLTAARAAWKAARVAYMQSEGFRFGNKIVDDWEGGVNSWPLDEGLIDYVAPGYHTDAKEGGNPLANLNIIASPRLRVGAETLDARVIDKDLLRKLNGAADKEANVSTGWHAIEFLLWGQDLHGTGPGAGERPATDYDINACTGGHCERRIAYLTAVTSLLIDDLKVMTADWAKDGAARKALFEKSPEDGLATIITGLANLSYSELAGDRMTVGLQLHDPEHEHDCFSDNTHNSYYFDEVGMIALWRGSYTRSDGQRVSGASLRDFALARSPATAKTLDARFAATLAKLARIKQTADSGAMAYDQMIGEGNAKGNKMVQDAIDALIAQTHGLEAVATGLKLKVDVEQSEDLAKSKGPPQ